MKIVNSSILKEWCANEYNTCDNGTLFDKLHDELKQFLAYRLDVPGLASELGCADGRNLTPLARKGYSLSGVDMVDSTVQSRKLNPWLCELNVQQMDVLSYNPEQEFTMYSSVLKLFTSLP